MKRAGGTMLITADHGNAEMMRDPKTGEPHTAHTINPVPLILVNPPAGVTGIGNGQLSDIAPTLLRASRHPAAHGDDRPCAGKTARACLGLTVSPRCCRR